MRPFTHYFFLQLCSSKYSEHYAGSHRLPAVIFIENDSYLVENVSFLVETSSRLDEKGTLLVEQGSFLTERRAFFVFRHLSSKPLRGKNDAFDRVLSLLTLS